MKQYNILSPDNISIRQENFNTEQDALDYYENEWKPRFKTQGYYSSNDGKIPLNELDDHCSIDIID